MVPVPPTGFSSPVSFPVIGSMIDYVIVTMTSRSVVTSGNVVVARSVPGRVRSDVTIAWVRTGLLGWESPRCFLETKICLFAGKSFISVRNRVANLTS